ncbi:MAG: PSD1 and planctomycete cytochrome C domain-containing protein [Gemmataceae bacterium]
MLFRTAKLALCALLATTAVRAETPDAPGIEFFETRVRPVLADKCYSCHADKKQMAGLRLDSREAVLAGGESGPAIVPGNPSKSRLIDAIQQSGDLKMPPKGKLTDAQIADLTTWVKANAPWPKPAATKGSMSPSETHWAFKRVVPPTLPTVRDPGQVATPVDTFWLARLDAVGLAPSAPAAKATLLRRVTFDLTGLPPTPDEVTAFLCDESPEAYRRVVDRLLASQHYGERWGRYWLDVSRYADSKGYVFQEERRYPFAYTYRDYVVDAFNRDKPYDRFVIEQLAADQLPLGDDKKPLAAMGFLTLGRRFLNNVHDIADDRIDVVSRGLLGLTVTCARCHDHKFDPIPIKDYYSLHGVFVSSIEPKELPLIAEPKQTAESTKYEAELAKLEAPVAAFRQTKRDQLAAAQRLAILLGATDATAVAVAVGPQPARLVADDKFVRLLDRQQRNTLQALVKKVDAHKANSPAAPPRAMVLTDAAQPTNPHVFLRGNPSNRGPNVPRQFLAVLSGAKRQPFQHGSGRLELAKAIVDPANPLTARVFVNRVWMHHFGKGLVDSPSDFGVRTGPPTHPELLDWLAAEFVARGWSVKELQRLIVLSNAYRQRSDDRPDALAKDPENRLVWKFPRQRLDLEALRDGLLAASGRLDPMVGGPAVDIATGVGVPRRTIYGFIDRQNLPGLFQTFDFASPDTHAPLRYSTTVPQQALFLLNSPFAVEQAKALVARSEVAALSQPELRIDALHRLLYARPATGEEIDLGLRFLDAAPTEGTKLTPWEQYAQVLLLANEFAFVD